MAVRNGHREAAGLLAAADGAGLRRRRPGAGRETALHQAAYDGRDGAVDWLLAHGADRHRLDGDHRSTPAGWAAHAGHRALAARLDPGSARP